MLNLSSLRFTILLTGIDYQDRKQIRYVGILEIPAMVTSEWVFIRSFKCILKRFSWILVLNRLRIVMIGPSWTHDPSARNCP